MLYPTELRGLPMHGCLGCAGAISMGLSAVRSLRKDAWHSLQVALRIAK
jgi:hypothetical protein